MSGTPSLFAGIGAQFFTNDGVPLAGGKIYSYEAGTTTPVVTYTTDAATTAHTNPIILDSAGRVPLGGQIWLKDGELSFYKFVLKTAVDVLIATYDYVPGTYSASDLGDSTDPAKGDALVGFRQSNVSGNLTGAIGRTVHQKLQEFVSAQDFGATSSLSIDAINAAISYAISSNTRVRFSFPATIRVPEDAPTIQAAIDAIYLDPTIDFLLTIRISAGYAIASGTLVENGDYSNIEITSADATVFAAATFSGINGGDAFCVNSLFVAIKAKAPRWAIYVDCNNIAGGLVYENSTGFIAGGKGVTDSNEYCLYVKNQSQVFATGAIFSLPNYGNRVTVNSMLNAANSNFSGTKNELYVGGNRAANLDVSRGSVVYVTGSAARPTNLTGGAGRGLAVRRSFVSATNVDCSNTAKQGLNASLGANVAFDGSLANACEIGVLCEASTVSFGNGIAINNTNYNIQCVSGGVVRARSATLTGGGFYGAIASLSGQIYLSLANCRRNPLIDQTSDMGVAQGGFISAVDAIGGFNSPTLVPTLNGLIIGRSSSAVIKPSAGNIATFVDIDFPEVTTADATMRIFRDTTTTGLKKVIVYIGNGTNTPTITMTSAGNLDIVGALSKGSGSFKIDHPIKPETHHLVHSFIEGPQADNIYRGSVLLQAGKAVVNLDNAARMTEGTFEALNANVQCYTTNESGWAAIRGKVDGNTLTIEAQEATSNDKISWLVIGERCDKHMKDTDWTDENGRVITEPLKESSNGG